ncbi:MAG: response regulator transcription factor [Deltaproteobacteria bacterium]|nr:response regulator transcription factor [Deltaproteobacteria bacterium]
MTGKDQKFRILIIDDHPIVREGLIQLINREPDLVACGEAGNFDEALRLAGSLLPDLALVDLSLNGQDGVELIKELVHRHPKLSVLVLSMLDESLYAERVLKAGARGYVMKRELTDKLFYAIREILKGNIYVSERETTTIINEFLNGVPHQSPPMILSDRELTVFRLIGQGYSTSQIAATLHLSVKTVETHKMHIKGKLNISDASHLAQYAVKWLDAEVKE